MGQTRGMWGTSRSCCKYEWVTKKKIKKDPPKMGGI